VEKHHKERCKSAPVPYDFSSIEVVSSVPEQGSDIQRLKAFTRPLTCMPDVVQNVLSHNGLRHCCSAYQPRPQTACSSRQQFWPVARPAVFHRGDVPKYLHFVKPAGFWIKGAEIHSRTAPDDSLSMIDNHHDFSARTDLPLHGEDDVEEQVLYEEQFLVPATPTEDSVSDREYREELFASRAEELQPEEDLNASPSEALADKYLGEDREDEECNSSNHVTPDISPELVQEELPPKEYALDLSDHASDPISDHALDPSDQDQGFEVIITKVEHSPDRSPSPGDREQEPDAGIPNNEKDGGDIQIVVPEIPQWATKEEDGPAGDNQNDGGLFKQDEVPQPDQEPGELVEPIKEVEVEPPKEAVIDRRSGVEMLKPQTNQVKFADSLILTSYKSPQPKKEKKEQPTKPTSILKPSVSKAMSPSPGHEVPKVSAVPEKKVSPAVERKVPDKPLRQVKPSPVKPSQEDDGKTEEKEEETPPTAEAKMAEERTQEPPKLEPEILPRPEYIRAPGAYRMYDPKDLLEFHLKQKREPRPVKKSLTSTTTMPQFKPSSESTQVVTTILDEQKRRREGMKPWLQGRLALSKQTSRFELPMDVRLLEAMTPMEYLTKYCIISTRRKALYKHIFQKVDKDRDNVITFKEMDRGLKEIHVDSITTEQVKKLIEMVEGNEKSTFNLAQFSAIAAFSERLLFSETQITEKNSVYSSKEVIEEADFCGLKSKLSGFPVNPTVRKILEVL